MRTTAQCTLVAVALAGLIVLGLAALPAGAQEQEKRFNSEITFYAGGFLGGSFVKAPNTTNIFPQVNGVFDDNFTGGFRLAYYITPRFALEGGLGFTPASISVAATNPNGGLYSRAFVSVDTYNFQANAVAHLLGHGPVIPFVTGGVAAVHFSFGDYHYDLEHDYRFTSPSETDFAWDAGGGVKIPIHYKDAAIRVDGRYYWTRPDFADNKTRGFTEVSGGLSILFNF